MMLNNKLFFFIQSCLKYFPFKLGIAARRLMYKPFFKNFGSQVTIHDNVLFKYPSDISIGNGVTFNTGNYIVGKGGLFIGNHVMIGAGSKIATSAHVFETSEIPMSKQGVVFNPIVVGNDVWLGFDVKVLAGVSIGDGCICGTSSVLIGGNFEPYSIIAGIPAKKVKNRRN